MREKRNLATAGSLSNFSDLTSFPHAPSYGPRDNARSNQRSRVPQARHRSSEGSASGSWHFMHRGPSILGRSSTQSSHRMLRREVGLPHRRQRGGKRTANGPSPTADSTFLKDLRHAYKLVCVSPLVVIEGHNLDQSFVDNLCLTGIKDTGVCLPDDVA